MKKLFNLFFLFLVTYFIVLLLSSVGVYVYSHGYYDGCKGTVIEICESLHKEDVEETLRCSGLSSEICEKNIERIKSGKR